MTVYIHACNVFWPLVIWRGTPMTPEDARAMYEHLLGVLPGSAPS